MSNIHHGLFLTIGVAVIMLVIGVAIGSVAFPLNKTETKTQTSTSTMTATISITRSYPQETITEIIIERSGIIGGAAFCEGNLSTPTGCVGGAIEEPVTRTVTSYAPPSTTNEMLNVTLTTITSYGVMSCANATTSSTTVSYNSTSGYGRIDWSWSQNCV